MQKQNAIVLFRGSTITGLSPVFLKRRLQIGSQHTLEIAAVAPFPA